MEPQKKMSDCYKEHRASLMTFCWRMVGNREVAEDIVQDVYLKSIEQNKPEICWLFTCARNICIDHLRRQGRWRKSAQRLRRALSWIPGFETQWLENDTGFRILRDLSPKSRSLLLLKIHGGFNYQELAEIFDTTPETVGVLLSRARKKAREQWKRETQP